MLIDPSQSGGLVLHRLLELEEVGPTAWSGRDLHGDLKEYLLQVKSHFVESTSVCSVRAAVRHAQYNESQWDDFTAEVTPEVVMGLMEKGLLGKHVSRFLETYDYVSADEILEQSLPAALALQTGSSGEVVSALLMVSDHSAEIENWVPKEVLQMCPMWANKDRLAQHVVGLAPSYSRVIASLYEASHETELLGALLGQGVPLADALLVTELL